MSDVERRINELFDLAGRYGNLAIRVKLGDKGDYKTYLTRDVDEPPRYEIILNNEKEERVFRMFRYPDLECEFIKEIVKHRIERGVKVEQILEKGVKLDDLTVLDPVIVSDYYFKTKYFSGSKGLYEVRSELRARYKDELISEAKSILGITDEKLEETVIATEIEPKPIYKSKTIITNVIAMVIVALLKSLGIDVSVEQIAYALCSLNVILRLLTKQPIRF